MLTTAESLETESMNRSYSQDYLDSMLPDEEYHLEPPPRGSMTSLPPKTPPRSPRSPTSPGRSPPAVPHSPRVPYQPGLLETSIDMPVSRRGSRDDLMDLEAGDYDYSPSHSPYGSQMGSRRASRVSPSHHSYQSSRAPSRGPSRAPSRGDVRGSEPYPSSRRQSVRPLPRQESGSGHSTRSSVPPGSRGYPADTASQLGSRQSMYDPGSRRPSAAQDGSHRGSTHDHESRRPSVHESRRSSAQPPPQRDSLDFPSGHDPMNISQTSGSSHHSDLTRPATDTEAIDDDYDDSHHHSLSDQDLIDMDQPDEDDAFGLDLGSDHLHDSRV